MDRTDKIHPHGYFKDYMRLAVELGQKATVCEIGVAQGASLVLWRSLFPDGMIIGIDTNSRSVWPPRTHMIIASQDDPELPDLVRQCAPDGCHLIIDDATHLASMTKATFTNLWPLIIPGGYYVIEDWADPWVFPNLERNPSDELIEYIPALIESLKEGASRVTYTYEGLVIIQKGLPGYEIVPCELRSL